MVKAAIDSSPKQNAAHSLDLGEKRELSRYKLPFAFGKESMRIGRGSSRRCSSRFKYVCCRDSALSRIEKCNRLVSWRAWAPFSSLPFFFLLPLDLEHTSSLALKSPPSIFLLSVGGNVFYYCHFWALINPRFCRV